MALREFTDSDGTVWQVWQVRPTRGPAYGGPERRQADAGAAEERRRARVIPRSSQAYGLESGWLCFEAPDEKRRLAPVPDGWESCSAEQLARYCAAARLVPRPDEPSRPDPLPDADPPVPGD